MTPRTLKPGQQAWISQKDLTRTDVGYTVRPQAEVCEEKPPEGEFLLLNRLTETSYEVEIEGAANQPAFLLSQA